MKASRRHLLYWLAVLLLLQQVWPWQSSSTSAAAAIPAASISSGQHHDGSSAPSRRHHAAHPARSSPGEAEAGGLARGRDRPCTWRLGKLSRQVRSLSPNVLVDAFAGDHAGCPGILP